MKKNAILTMIVAMFIVTYGLNCYGQELTSQINILEQRADRIQGQINQAKQQAQSTLDQQVKAIQSTIDNLVNQRVQLDAHVAKLEGQMDEMKKSAQSNLERQISSYTTELSTIKQQISGMVAQKKADVTQKVNDLSKQQAAPQAVATTAPPTGALAQ
jgi:chromosome segregation ATPase